MSTQLRLIEGGARRSGHRLDARTRRVGRVGVARARAALGRGTPPPEPPLRKAG